jgi:predicted dehydrogenase
MSERKAQKGRTQKVRYAVVGLGYISQIAVLPAFSHSRENSEVTALVSGDRVKLKSLARKYRIAHTYSYEQYADCLASGNVDAVYIALPNHMHRAYAEPAARAGIHILCEKPMAFEEAECEAMIAEAEKAKVKLMIAYRLHFERGNLHAIQVVNSGRIGEPRIFTSSFSQQVRSGNSRLKKDIGGGPLYDLGVYCINAARYLFRAEPEQVFAWHSGGDGDRFREVPATTTAMLQFPGNRVASFTCSFGAADRSVFEVIGTKGVLRMDPAYEMVEALKSEISIRGKTTKQVFRRRDQFAAELVYFSGCILNHQDPEPSGREGLADVRIIQALLQSAETNRPVAIRTTEVSRRPTMTQEIARTAGTKPRQLVKASAPGKE